jgi:hypothetical protein
VKPPPPVDRFIYIKDVSRLDLQQLADEVAPMDWAALYATSDVDRQVSLLSEFVKRLYDYMFVFQPGENFVQIRRRHI